MKLHPPSSSPQGAHAYPLRVYYEDTDAGGVVYHANYLRFAERARTEALRALDAPHAQMASLHGLMFMVRRVKVDYLAPARLDDSLTVLTETRSIRGASAELRQSVTRAGAVLVALDVQLACVGIADGRPARIPQRWRDALERTCLERDDRRSESRDQTKILPHPGHD
jgi:acyl-CoA thioester hydrolase